MARLFCASNYYCDPYYYNIAAESFNEDIGAWDTSGVTAMNSMFVGASSFNQDIGGWAVDKVTDMHAVFYVAASFNQPLSEWSLDQATSTRGMFGYASSFNQPISDWQVDKVTNMRYMFYKASAFNQNLGDWSVDNVLDMSHMFYYASAFDQNLGWCVGDVFDIYGNPYGYDIEDAFDGTPCASTSCGVAQGICDYPMTDSIIRTAVEAWLSDAAAAEATYGHISTWETSGVTDMSYLFCGIPESSLDDCNSAAASFNEDIGAWDTSGVTSMFYMFREATSFNQDIGDWAVHSVMDMSNMFNGASAFNQDISDWAVDSVKTMSYIFKGASAFNQDLGWCVDDDVNLGYAFSYSGCESTSCGVVRCPTKENNKEQTPVSVIAGAAVAAVLLLLLVGFSCLFYKNYGLSKRSMAEPSDVNSRPEPSPQPPKEVVPTEEAAVVTVAPEAEESPRETLAEEPPPQETTVDEPPPAPAKKGWSFWGAEPEPEEAEQPPPLSPFSALRAERERELKTLASP